MIKAVLIDIDDTLLDFGAYVRQCMKDGFKKYGICEYDDSMYTVFRQVNTSLWQQLEKGMLTFAELTKTRWNKVFEALGVSFDGCLFEKYFRNALFDSAIPVDGAYELLRYLDSRYTLCVASNGPFEQQMNRIRTSGMDRYFSHFFISEKVGASKPSAEFFEYCTDTLGVQPCEIMMIGDSLSSDIAGANAYGMKTCFFDRHDVGAPKYADYTVTGLCQIKSIL